MVGYCQVTFAYCLISVFLIHIILNYVYDYEFLKATTKSFQQQKNYSPKFYISSDKTSISYSNIRYSKVASKIITHIVKFSVLDFFFKCTVKKISWKFT